MIEIANKRKRMGLNKNFKTIKNEMRDSKKNFIRKKIKNENDPEIEKLIKEAKNINNNIMFKQLLKHDNIIYNNKENRNKIFNTYRENKFNKKNNIVTLDVNENSNYRRLSLNDKKNLSNDNLKIKTNFEQKKYIEQNYLNGNNSNLKNNNNENYIPVEERLFYSSDELEKEQIINKKSNKTIVEENGKIKINLKEIKQQIKEKEKSNTLNPSKKRKIKKIEIINIPENINKNSQIPFIQVNENINQNESSNINLINNQIQENSLQNGLNIEKKKKSENIFSTNIENELKEKIVNSDICDKNNNIINKNIMIEENMNNDNLINDENIDNKKNKVKTTKFKTQKKIIIENRFYTEIINSNILLDKNLLLNAQYGIAAYSKYNEKKILNKNINIK